MRNEDNENDRIKQQALLAVDTHIIEAIKQGREISMQEVEAMEEQYLCPSQLILERIKFHRAEHADMFGFNNKSAIDKALVYFKKAGLRRNAVLNRIENKKGEHVTIDDIYINLLRADQKVPREDLRSLIASRHVETFNPFQQYLDRLETMNFDAGVDYFANLSGYIQTDNPEFFAVMLKKHFVRSIDQYKRNVPNRYIVTLYGGQEAGKSMFIRWMNPLGENYYSEQPLRADKDCEILLATVLIYSLEELEGLSKQEITKTKSFISRAIINERRPYAAEAVPMPRLASIFASTNDREFLTDAQNTRWLVFDVKSINHDYHNLRTGRKDIDINSLWWQAYNEWKTDNSAGMLVPKEKELQTCINIGYEIATPEYHLILKHLREPTEEDLRGGRQFPGGGGGIEFLSSTDILVRLTGLYPGIKINATWIGREMRRAGFETSWKWINGKSFRGYQIVWMEQGNPEDKPVLPF
jgi:hypothetical protein